ncbi:MAG: C25 family cysteine peptidase [Candidatus Aegiribacteria sp.]
MLSTILLVLLADMLPIHTTVADSTRVAFIAQTPVSWEDVEYDSLSYIRFTDSHLTDSIGYPELPMITCMVAFPDSVTPYLEYAFSDMRDQFINPVFPAPAQVLSYERTPAVVDSFVQDSIAYSSDEFWPSERVRIIGETRICDQRLLQVQMFPAQYRASDSTLRTVSTLSVSISFDSASAEWSSIGLGPFQRMVDRSSIIGYHPVLQTHAPYPEYFGEVDPQTGPTRMPDYLIICASGLYDQCDGAIDSLAEHRVSLNGFDVALVTTDAILEDFGGSDTVLTDEIIRDFTEHMWVNWGQPTTKKPGYLLLIGDHEDASYYDTPWFLPTHQYPWNEIPTPASQDMVGNDEWYAYFNHDRDINNDFPDMMVGRLSVKNGEWADTLSIMIQNLIDLEDPAGHPPTPDYRRRILRLAGTGEDDDTGYQSYQNWEPSKQWTRDFSGWMGYDYSTTYCGDGRDFIDKDGSILSSHEWRDICLAEFGKGAGVAFYSNHGDFHMLSAGLEWLHIYIPQDTLTRGAQDSTFNNYQIEEYLSIIEDYAPPFVLLLCCGSGTFNHTIDHHEDRPTYLTLCHFDDATSQVAAYDFGSDCIAERLLKNTDVPMAGVFCGSLSSVTRYYEYYGKGILEAVYIRGFGRLGDAIASARTQYNEDFLEINGSYPREMGQFNLLGDPALDISDRIKYPNACDLVIHESDITVSGYPYETSTGTELSMSFTVRNNGAQDSDEFDARIVFSHGENSSTEIVECDELEAGAEAVYEYTWDCANWFDPPMELTVSIEADYLEECDDSWRGNNSGSCSVQLNDTYPTEEGWPVSAEGIVGSTPVLVNLDQDPDLEIVALTGTFLTAFENDGTVIWKIKDQGFSSAQHPMAADLDQDGTIELLLDSSEGIKVVSSTGSILDCVDDLSWDCFVVGNMHPTEGLELCAADGACIALYYWHSTREEFIYIEDEDLQSSGLWSGVSLACADLTGNSYEDVVYCYNSFGIGNVDRYLDVYDWASETVAYSNDWTVSPYVSYVAAGELAGTKEVGYSFGSYVSGSSDPAMLVEFNGSVQVYDCDQGDTDAGNLLCGVFADWDPLEPGADAFVLPSEIQCLAWNYEGAELSGWPTELYSGSEYGSFISPTALGNLDDYGYSDVLFCTILAGDCSLFAFDSDGDLLDNPDFPIVLPEDVFALGGFGIADVDRDGSIEIVFGTSDGLLHCWELGDCTTGYAPWAQFQHDHGRTGVLE